MLIEKDDAVALSEHMAVWAGLLELNISPVVADEETPKAVFKVF